MQVRDHGAYCRREIGHQALNTFNLGVRLGVQAA